MGVRVFFLSLEINQEEGILITGLQQGIPVGPITSFVAFHILHICH